MSIRVLLRDFPSRSIALVTASHALIFRHSPSTADSLNNGSQNPSQSRMSLDSVTAPRCMVEFTALDTIDISDYRNICPVPAHGTLGLITINNDIFLCIVTGASKVASVRPGETVEKIYAVEFYCLNCSEHDSITNDDMSPYGTERIDGYAYGQSVGRRDTTLEHPCTDLKKLLSNGSFYYSTDFDLTNRLQDRSVEPSTFDIENLDESFLWNSYMIQPLVKFRSRLVPHEKEVLDASRILTSAIRGFVLTITIPLSSAPIRTTTSGLPSSLTLISRLSCLRAGTRFNSRGIDDDGNVANFVESETIYWSPSGLCFSYTQVRGSVPVFWEQAAGLIPGQQKISITRSKEGTQPAFDKHFQGLENAYGAIHVVNLLSETKAGEAELTGLYRYGVRHSSLNQGSGKNSQDHELLRETEFDFHAETKGPNGYEAASMVRHLIEGSAKGFAYYLSEDIEDPPDRSGNGRPQRRSVVNLQQEGVFRTNCLDCLDRTNLVQTIISQMAIEAFLSYCGERATSNFWMRHSSLWADNGDALSKIYAGTGALKSSFTRHGKMSLAGAIADAGKSAARLYINNFADKGRQNTMDILLGRLVGQTPVHLYDPINDYVASELNKRSGEYSSFEVINILVGTFNLNGRTEGTNEDLSEWLCRNTDPSEEPVIVVVGFQEIVELSPQQIMNSDPTRKRAWEKTVKRTLNRHAQEAGSEHYVLLRSGQLVGTALCIFVKASVLRNIKNVEGGVKKTGLSGMAGNKGAVAIRMEYANTQICFVTAHLAAGFANYDERNRDYHTIHHGLRFQRNRGIDDHDAVIWLGDFNYRIGMSSERVKSLIKMNDLDTLYENDQLNIQMVAGLTFPHYSEARITFMPTYRFDLGSDEYDTSEKARIPAWTDRILCKGNILRQTSYGAAPGLRFSDHRPVFATFQCRVTIIDEAHRESLSHQIYAKRRAEVGSTVASSRADDTDDEDLIGYDPIEPGLPPASSDRRKWWLENSLPARSIVQPPHRRAMLNSNRPSNPFQPTDEPDWVTVPKPTRAESYQSTASSTRSEGRGITIPRRLPPPFDPSPYSAPGVATSSPALLSKTPANPSLPVSHSDASQSSSSQTKKEPPPVARKPIHLSSSSSPASLSNGFEAAVAARPTSSVAKPAPNKTTPGVQTEFLPPPRRPTGTGQFHGGRSSAGATLSPPLPGPRRSGAAKGGRAGNGSFRVNDDYMPKLPPRPVDLLGDGEEMGLKGWEVLRPS